MDSKIHVLALPYSGGGHLTPLLHFTQRLASKGIKITLVIPTVASKNWAAVQIEETSSFKIEYISDGTESSEAAGSLEAYFSKLEAEVTKNLSKLIEKLSKSNLPPAVLVYDSALPWALDVAHQHGLRGASFFIECCAINCIHYEIFKGTLKMGSEIQSAISVPPLPPLQIHDLPCYPSVGNFDQTVEKFFSNQFMNIQRADWILINTFEKLEIEVVRWMASKLPIKTIGPTLLKEFNGTDHGLAKNPDSCIKWLDRREMGSVVYVSFGSLIKLGEQQMKEIARGLVSSNCYLLWIVRTEEESKLPENFKSEISEKGLILEWCPQLEVLAHEAVACFITLSDWNSTLEALSSGVPMIAMPYMTDQTTNAKFIADVWEAGVRAKANSNGIFTGEEIEMRIREVTQSERGKELKQNVVMWKQEIEKATAPGGSSYRNIEDFVSQVSKLPLKR